MPPFLSKHYLSVTPVIATVPADFVPRPNPGEVAAVFDMPLAAFLDTTSHSSRDLTWQVGAQHELYLACKQDCSKAGSLLQL